MRRALFGDRGYGLNANGSEESVQAIQMGEVQSLPRKTRSAE